MKAEYRQRGENVNYLNGTGAEIKAGTLVMFAAFAAIAAADIPDGEAGALSTEGVWILEKDSAAIDFGAAVYYNEGDDVVTASEDNGESNDALVSYTRIGVAVSAAKAADETVYVKLNA